VRAFLLEKQTRQAASAAAQVDKEQLAGKRTTVISQRKVLGFLAPTAVGKALRQPVDESS
jgi:hypothetical protein